jgi:hypothetical protein
LGWSAPKVWAQSNNGLRSEATNGDIPPIVAAFLRADPQTY